MSVELKVIEAIAGGEQQQVVCGAPQEQVRDLWKGLVHDVIGRALEVLLLEGGARLSRIGDYRRELHACDEWLELAGNATLVSASAEDLSDHLLELIHCGLTVERAETVLEALRFFFGYLREMGFRDDDPTLVLDLSWIH